MEDFNGDPHGISFFLNPILIGSASAFSCTMWAALHSSPLLNCLRALSTLHKYYLYLLCKSIIGFCLLHVTKVLLLLLSLKEEEEKKKTNLGWNGFYFFIFYWGGGWGLWKRWPWILWIWNFRLQRSCVGVCVNPTSDEC